MRCSQGGHRHLRDAGQGVPGGRPARGRCPRPRDDVLRRRGPPARRGPFKGPGRADLTERELQVAQLLIDSMGDEWDPDRYHDTYRQQVEELVDQKRQGEAIVTEAQAPRRSNVVDLMEALQASVEAARDGRGSAEDPARPAPGHVGHEAEGRPPHQRRPPPPPRARPPPKATTRKATTRQAASGPRAQGSRGRPPTRPPRRRPTHRPRPGSQKPVAKAGAKRSLPRHRHGPPASARPPEPGTGGGHRSPRHRIGSGAPVPGAAARLRRGGGRRRRSPRSATPPRRR